MKYKDFYKDLITESAVDVEPSITFIQTNLGNGIKIGFVSKGDSGDRIRASHMRVSYKNKIHGCLVTMNDYLFKKLRFKPIEVEIVFSVIKGDDNEYGREQAYVYRGDNKIFIRSEFLSNAYSDVDVVRILVHEWAHIWHYDNIDKVDKLIEDKYEIVKLEKKKRISPYGLTNHHEFWTFLIESYDKLDTDLKQFVDYVVGEGK